MYLVHVDSTIRPPSPLVDLRGLFVNPPSPPSGPHGLRMTPTKKFSYIFGWKLVQNRPIFGPFLAKYVA